ncbi:DNA-binding SARP family transcriptional activator [Hamadaea flava]|uniref:BTAD domain-containing putative transcriptional regulator n=1 Tax=Hamadaea flava TaxID=1742688 RepID=A0ABV8LMT1_9ACTN|nr:BTAD domain-containing putative transcriptional regulator [Hamadaea flava]MCP2324078.1 DNA-binding SARP family transcriptional activator [Hamadaea flava]
MRIRLLGSIEVEAGGRTLDAGPLQRRAVLAALAMDAGSPVGLDALVERVWGADPPEAPRSALYAHIARLRRLFAGHGVRLIKQVDGYVLNLDRERVDVHRIGRLLEAYRGDPGRVADLREAMDLWRGRPLAQLTGFWAAKVRRGVESQLVGVASAWAAEELRRGNAETVADRLAPIVESHPLAEPVVAQHMWALCALGRTSEALQCYAVVRTQIAEQLGVEPGAELRDLHVAVLRGEVTAPVRLPAYRQLFYDDAELRDLGQLVLLAGRLETMMACVYAMILDDDSRALTHYLGGPARLSAAGRSAADRLRDEGQPDLAEELALWSKACDEAREDGRQAVHVLPPGPAARWWRTAAALSAVDDATVAQRHARLVERIIEGYALGDRIAARYEASPSTPVRSADSAHRRTA